MDLPNQDQQVAIVSEAQKKAIPIAVSTAVAQTVLFSVDFTAPQVHALNAQTRTGPAMTYNRDAKNSWMMLCPGVSYLKIQNHLDAVDSAKKYVLEFVHLSEKYQSKMFSPISIVVNGETAVSEHNPDSGTFIMEDFDISKYLKTGDNVIEINFDYGALTNYWIQSLVLLCS